MTKTKTAIEKPNTDSAVFSYDADAQQAIPLEINFRGRARRVIHNLAPLTDARFFQLERERDEAKKRLVKAGGLSTEAYAPNTALWDDLAQSIEGFAPDAEWKTKTHFLDKTNAIGAFLHTAEVEEEDPLDDDSELYGGTVYSKFGTELRYPLTLSPSVSVYALAFFEAGNLWKDFESVNYSDLKKSYWCYRETKTGKNRLDSTSGVGIC
jgi:hypothetical protein